METTKKILAALGWSDKGEDFAVGKDNFNDLEIRPSEKNDQFYYFYLKKDKRLIKQFVLDEKTKVDYLCRVALIKNGEKFTPRLALSVRDKAKQIVQDQEIAPTNIKANVALEDCHENFWKLIGFLQTLKTIDVPKEIFSLMSQDENEIVEALRGRGTDSVANIIKVLSAAPDINLTQKDINSLLKRRERLAEFKKALDEQATDEGWWQKFFENNKWIFGYGLNYEILRHEQGQPNYGGTRLDGTGGQRGDHLMSTMGDLNFTVLVEIKTPATPLLQGSAEIRNGAWSLSKNFTDALVQIQANIQTWELDGSDQTDNKDRLEKESVYTVKPKGIVVIGSLEELKKERHQWETFQRFRKSIHGIDIITFDELLNRASFIVDSN
jgi:hypothetical protein